MGQKHLAGPDIVNDRQNVRIGQVQLGVQPDMNVITKNAEEIIQAAQGHADTLELAVYVELSKARHRAGLGQMMLFDKHMPRSRQYSMSRMYAKLRMNGWECLADEPTSLPKPDDVSWISAWHNKLRDITVETRGFCQFSAMAMAYQECTAERNEARVLSLAEARKKRR